MQPELIAGRYRVLKAVGRGGMGAVWLCRDEVLLREVALKQIEDLAEEPAAKAARPLREARVAAALNHENAVSMYDIVEDHGSTWLVMEYVPSRTLAEVLHEEGRLPVDRVARIGAQLASALAVAHGLGIVHRDIKPGNVLVGENDLAKISDFGIARGHRDEQLTLTGFVSGTPAYFSPELARGGDPSEASDVWALGATLYAAVEGEPPYGKDPNPLALLARIASQPPPPPMHAGKLTSTLGSMLSLRVETRASMEAVVTSLHQLAEPADVDAARIREKGRAFADTTLHDRPMPIDHQPAGVLDEMLGAVRPPGDDRPTVATPTAGHSPTRVTALPDEDATPTDRGRPSPQLLVLALAALLVLLIAGALVWSLSRSPAGDDSTAPPASGPRSQQTPATSSPEHPTTSTQTTDTGPEPSTPQNTKKTKTIKPPPAGETPAAFVVSYFQLVPDDLKSGWKALGPSMRQVGRESYENFWGSIDSVDLAEVGAIDAETVDYQITYHFSDGRIVQEEKRIELARHGHGYWITGDTVLSSTTLHS